MISDYSAKTRKTAVLGMFLALALIMGYIESLLPPLSGIPGVKLGLSNIVTLITMEVFGKKEALVVLLLRIVLSGLLFGNMFSMVFSLSGGLLAFAAMGAGSMFKALSITGVSMLGGVFHNIGQLIAAAIVVDELKIAYYGPVLLISGLLTGFVTGLIAKIVLSYIRKAL
ncbi:MAG: Gx transporter family protein [Lachnospiraceae bacterium]|nr:Gx transporter family protein [Lachnospiraceae bacterium]